MRGPQPRNRLLTLGKGLSKVAVVLKMRIGAWSEAFWTRCLPSTKSWSYVCLKVASAPFRRPRWILQLFLFLEFNPFCGSGANLRLLVPNPITDNPLGWIVTPDEHSRLAYQLPLLLHENLKSGHDSCLLYLGFLSWVGTTFHDQLVRGSVCQALHTAVRFSITFHQPWQHSVPHFVTPHLAPRISVHC